MEHTVRLTPAENLVGVVSTPDRNTTQDVAMIFINAGFLHRVGPYRLYTDLCRELASKGIPSLRFDLTGLGDSQQSKGQFRRTSLESLPGPVADIQVAMDFMQTEYGISRFLVSGLCSGADDSLDVALTDDRVVGAFLIDGPGFKTSRFHLFHYLMHYPRRVITPRKWRVVLDRITRRDPQNPEDDLNDDIRRNISKEELCSITTSLVQKKTALMFLYTGGVSDYYNHKGQFQQMFPELSESPLVSNLYLPDSDHLFMLHQHRDELKQHVVNWSLSLASQRYDEQQVA